MSKTIYDRSKFYVKHVMSINAWNQELPLKVIVLSWKKHLVLSKRINQFSSGKILDKSYNFRHGRSTGDLTAEYEKIFNNWLTIKIIGKKWRLLFKIDTKIIMPDVSISYLCMYEENSMYDGITTK